MSESPEHYARSHEDRVNLLIHLFAVPLFWVATPPASFQGPFDFASRIYIEQFWRFPIFLLSGGWLRSWHR